jgi:hypothetical protein
MHLEAQGPLLSTNLLVKEDERHWADPESPPRGAARKLPRLVRVQVNKT